MAMLHSEINACDVQGHPGIFLQFGSLIKYFKDVKLERQAPKVHHIEGSGIAKVGSLLFSAFSSWAARHMLPADSAPLFPTAP